MLQYKSFPLLTHCILIKHINTIHISSNIIISSNLISYISIMALHIQMLEPKRHGYI